MLLVASDRNLTQSGVRKQENLPVNREAWGWTQGHKQHSEALLLSYKFSVAVFSGSLSSHGGKKGHSQL